MSVTSQARQQMRQRARVLGRRGETQRDEYGAPDPHVGLQVLYDALPVNTWIPTDSQQLLGAGEAVIGALRLTMPIGTSIQSGDVIEQVVDRIGRVIHDGPLHVLVVMRRTGHIAVVARIQEGSRSDA